MVYVSLLGALSTGFRLRIMSLDNSAPTREAFIPPYVDYVQYTDLMISSKMNDASPATWWLLESVVYNVIDTTVYGDPAARVRLSFVL